MSAAESAAVAGKWLQEEQAIIADLRRELAKAEDVLTMVEDYLAKYPESMAALHCATKVMYSPLHARVYSVLDDLRASKRRVRDTYDGADD